MKTLKSFLRPIRLFIVKRTAPKRKGDDLNRWYPSKPGKALYNDAYGDLVYPGDEEKHGICQRCQCPVAVNEILCEQCKSTTFSIDIVY